MESVDLNDESGLVTVFRLSAGGTDEMEVETVRGLLESNGIATILVGDQPMPNFSEEIRVARDDADRAKDIIAQALEAGSSGADEAEAASEK